VWRGRVFIAFNGLGLDDFRQRASGQPFPLLLDATDCRLKGGRETIRDIGNAISYAHTKLHGDDTAVD